MILNLSHTLGVSSYISFSCPSDWCYPGGQLSPTRMILSGWHSGWDDPVGRVGYAVVGDANSRCPSHEHQQRRKKADFLRNHPQVLAQFKVKAKDREYQFWERNPLSVELRTDAVYKQKLDYIHWNPVRARLCELPEDYKYSSAKFYETGIDDFEFITHFRG